MLLHIGFSNTVAINKIVAILSPETAASKRIRDLAKDDNYLIDCTMGRKLRSVILTNASYVLLSTIRPEALIMRMNGTERNVDLKSSELPA